MASAAGIVFAAGGVTLANEVVFAPVATGGKITESFNWRIIPATLLAAAALSGLEQVLPTLARGVAWIALVTVLFARLGNAPAPMDNLAALFGQGSKSQPAPRKG